VGAFTISHDEIQTHSANMHPLPVNDSVIDDIANFRAGYMLRYRAICLSVCVLLLHNKWIKALKAFA